MKKCKMQNSMSHEKSILPWRENKGVYKYIYVSECMEIFCKDLELKMRKGKREVICPLGVIF